MSALVGNNVSESALNWNGLEFQNTQKVLELF